MAFGVVCGLGLMNKLSMLVFGAGLAIGLLLTPARRWLATPWPWTAAAIAGLMFLPHVLWQQANGWPTIEFVRNAQRFKIADSGPVTFLASQALFMHPLALPITLGGLWFFFRARHRREWALFGWAALSVTAILLLQRSKPYYLTPVYPLLFAGGSVWLEQRLPHRAARASALALLVAGGVVLAPMALPVLPVAAFLRYQERLGLTPPAQEKHELAELPQHFADMHGWEELASEISRIYQSLPETDRPVARVFASNYGQAGAIDYFRGRGYPLPRAISPHNNYWLWGPGPDEDGVLIIIGGRAEDHRHAFDRVEQAGVTRCGDCMPYENHRPIFVARGIKVRPSEIWPREKNFI
jgi:hypothetical protein